MIATVLFMMAASLLATVGTSSASTTTNGTISGRITFGPVGGPCKGGDATAIALKVGTNTTVTKFADRTTGDYTLSVPPGQYYVLSRCPTVTYATFYPATQNAGYATKITVPSGGSISNINIVIAGLTTTTMAPRTESISLGQSVTLTATVAPHTPNWPVKVTGPVSFCDSATILATATVDNGTAQTQFKPLQSGTYEINAQYQTTTDYLASASNGGAQDGSKANNVPNPGCPGRATNAVVIVVTGGSDTNPPWLQTLNADRTAFGLPPVVQDPVLSQQMAEHAAYLVQNGPGKTIESETPSEPGYTTAGAWGAMASIWINGLASTATAQALNIWMNSVYHYSSLLSPTIHVVGAAHDGIYYGLEDDSIAWPAETAAYPLEWPPNGSTAQDLYFRPSQEDPDVLNSHGWDCGTGWATVPNGENGPVLHIALHNDPTLAGKVPQVTMTSSSGVTDPVCPIGGVSAKVDEPGYVAGLSLLPKYPLQYGESYTVKITDGPSWSFKAPPGSFSFTSGIYNDQYVGRPVSTGVSYQVQGYTTVPTISLVAGQLPPGLSFSAPTMDMIDITGTPTQAGTYSFTLNGADGTSSATITASITVLASPSPTVTTGSLDSTAIGMTSLPTGKGYWLVNAAGQVSAHGNAHNYGTMSGHPLNKPIVGMAATPTGGGYWLVASDGGIFSFGNAQFHGSMGGKPLNKPIVGMALDPTTGGYWEVASDGGIFSFDAPFHGSMGGKPLNKPVVSMALDPATGGYWEVASDGGIFSFDAPFYGSMGGKPLNRPVNGMTTAPNGSGYRMVASDGGIFSFGAPFYGSMGGQSIPAPIVGMASDLATNGYWMLGQNGTVYSFNATFYGGH